MASKWLRMPGLPESDAVKQSMTLTGLRSSTRSPASSHHTLLLARYFTFHGYIEPILSIISPTQLVILASDFPTPRL